MLKKRYKSYYTGFDVIDTDLKYIYLENIRRI